MMDPMGFLNAIFAPDVPGTIVDAPCRLCGVNLWKHHPARPEYSIAESWEDDNGRETCHEVHDCPIDAMPDDTPFELYPECDVCDRQPYHSA
jgi:hypothetical protein